jgi:hypothetical protein
MNFYGNVEAAAGNVEGNQVIHPPKSEDSNQT